MPWLQLTLAPGDEDPEYLSETMQGAGAVSVTLQDAAADPLYEPAPGATPLWPRTKVVGLFAADADLEAVRSALHAALGTEPQLSVEPLEDRDWTRAWLDHYGPMRFGRRLWVAPHGSPEPPGAVQVTLDPGLAFGTGTHPTTALCLEWLDGAAVSGRRIIDYGCGSGILGIAAARLGAAEVWAVDNDAQALAATAGNSHGNGVAAVLHACAPDNLPPVRADVLLANILAAPLLVLAPRFGAHLCRGGALVLSGILEGQADEVRARYTEWFDMHTPLGREGWVRLDGVRR